MDMSARKLLHKQDLPPSQAHDAAMQAHDASMATTAFSTIYRLPALRPSLRGPPSMVVVGTTALRNVLADQLNGPGGTEGGAGGLSHASASVPDKHGGPRNVHAPVMTAAPTKGSYSLF